MIIVPSAGEIQTSDEAGAKKGGKSAPKRKNKPGHVTDASQSKDSTPEEEKPHGLVGAEVSYILMYVHMQQRHLVQGFKK